MVLPFPCSRSPPPPYFLFLTIHLDGKDFAYFQGGWDVQQYGSFMNKPQHLDAIQVRKQAKQK